MRFKSPRPKKKLHRINEEIRSEKVRLIDEEKQQIGIVPTKKALEIAMEKELDLVEISPNSDPPVCRILDYGKYIYSIQKKAQKAQKHQKKVHLKEIKFTPAIGEHDFDVKLRKIKQFLADGNKVKVTVWLRGRQKRKPEMLEVMTRRIMGVLTEISEIESSPKFEKFYCHILVGQKKGGKYAKTEDT